MQKCAAPPLAASCRHGVGSKVRTGTPLAAVWSYCSQFGSEKLLIASVLSVYLRTPRPQKANNNTVHELYFSFSPPPSLRPLLSAYLSRSSGSHVENAVDPELLEKTLVLRVHAASDVQMLEDTRRSLVVAAGPTHNLRSFPHPSTQPAQPQPTESSTGGAPVNVSPKMGRRGRCRNQNVRAEHFHWPAGKNIFVMSLSKRGPTHTRTGRGSVKLAV